MKQAASTLVLLVFLLSGGCKNVVFNNPLDPDASRAVLSVVRVMETLPGGRGDLCFDDEKIWKIDDSGTLNALDRDSGSLIRSFYTPPGTGVEFHDGLLYICNGESTNELTTLDPLSGDIIERIPTGEIYPAFLAADNNRFLLYDSRSAGIFDYDPVTGDRQRLFEVPGLEIGGMALYKNTLLIADINADAIYRFSLSGDVMNVYSSPTAGLAGITVDHAHYVYLFIPDGKIYKVSLP